MQPQSQIALETRTDCSKIRGKEMNTEREKKERKWKMEQKDAKREKKYLNYI